jgi:hypothetical protein
MLFGILILKPMRHSEANSSPQEVCELKELARVIIFWTS